MTIKNLLCLTILWPAIAAAQSSATAEHEIGMVLDDFHDAAAQGDKARYLGHMTEDGVFMGTDEWERWPKNPDFAAYVGGRFKDGRGWTYKSVERKVAVSKAADSAWFDEVIFSESSGRFRGTGVLVKQDDEWKIAHYAMSFLVFNENWEDVIELTKKTAVQKNAAE